MRTQRWRTAATIRRSLPPASLPNLHRGHDFGAASAAIAREPEPARLPPKAARPMVTSNSIPIYISLMDVTQTIIR